MSTVLLLPRLGETMEQGRVVAWLKRPGDAFVRGETIVEIETDKTVVELPALADGVLRRIDAEVGTDVDVGAPLGAYDPIGTDADVPPDDNAVPTADPAAQDGAGSGTARSDRDATRSATHDGSTVGTGQRETPPQPVGPRAASSATAASGAGAAVPADTSAAAAAVPAVPASRSAVPADPRPRATPNARRLARAHGLTLADIPGSGRRGRIGGDDVEAAIAPAARRVVAGSAAGAATVADTVAAADAGTAGHAAPAAGTAPAIATAPPVDAALAADAARGADAAPTLALDAAPTSATATAMVALRAGWMAYRNWAGRPTGAPPIVLLHGFAGDSQAWAVLAAHLQRRGRRVVAPDLPSHGATEFDRVDPTAMVGDVVDFIDALGLDRIELVGHSLGAIVATRAAERLAARVERLTLLAPAGLGSEIDADFVAGMATATQGGGIAHLLRRIAVHPPMLSPQQLDDMARRTGGRAAIRELADRLVGHGRQQIDIVAELAALTVPARVVWGLDDRIVPWRHAVRAGPRIPVFFLPGAGHMPQWDQPQQVAALFD